MKVLKVVLFLMLVIMAVHGKKRSSDKLLKKFESNRTLIIYLDT